MVVIFAHFVPFWIKKGIFTRVEPSGDAPQWPPQVLPVLRHTNHSHKILGGSKKRFFEYLGWATLGWRKLITVTNRFRNTAQHFRSCIDAGAEFHVAEVDRTVVGVLGVEWHSGVRK